jgi:diphthine-ammonia ligase
MNSITNQCWRIFALKVAVLWSGGKDSSLACYKAIAQGYDVNDIVTFIWETPSPCAHAHPLLLIALQSKALGIKHIEARVKDGQPYFEQYIEAISHLIKEDGIEGIVTGDIVFLDISRRNWMDDICRELSIKIIKPLWDIDRYEMLTELISQGFKAVFTSVEQRWFDETWLGRELDWECLEDLKELREKYGIDLCGEFGEYHTMIVDAPFFKETIEISKFSKEKMDAVLFMKVIESSLKPKDPRKAD